MVPFPVLENGAVMENILCTYRNQGEAMREERDDTILLLPVSVFLRKGAHSSPGQLPLNFSAKKVLFFKTSRQFPTFMYFVLMAWAV